MQAIEFDSVIENGIIRVPEQYREIISSPVRGIVLTDEVISHSERKKVSFDAISIDTKGFKFDREEANARR
jgi:hypothetical protein